MGSLIEVKKLNFSYLQDKKILNDVNIKVQEGTFTCIVGENGSGKSTLLKCILGLNKGYEGEIEKPDFESDKGGDFQIIDR